MNLQQLEYVVAVDKYRHFVSAAEACNVTQPTLSSMIQKLETELDAVVFDRNAHPVKPTAIGEDIIKQAKVILYNASQLKELVLSNKEMETGELKVGIIPTVAPYLLPGLFSQFRTKHSAIKLHITEMRTKVLLDQLDKAEIDMAILTTPLMIDSLLEIPLYYEEFVCYVSPDEPLYSLKEVPVTQMPTNHLWVLQEGHCLRKQVFNFCHAKSEFSAIYEAGSIDTLVKIVDSNGGYTIIPKMHVDSLTENQKLNLRPFISPAPVREISIVIRNDYVRERMLNIVADVIKAIIPEQMLDPRLKKFAIKL